jgi:hypothetical protein
MGAVVNCESPASPDDEFTILISGPVAKSGGFHLQTIEAANPCTHYGLFNVVLRDGTPVQIAVAPGASSVMGKAQLFAVGLWGAVVNGDDGGSGGAGPETGDFCAPTWPAVPDFVIGPTSTLTRVVCSSPPSSI